MSKAALELAIIRAGGIKPFAASLDTSTNRVRYWLVRPDTPGPTAELVLRIEAQTGISRHDLRADIYPREEAA